MAASNTALIEVARDLTQGVTNMLSIHGLSKTYRGAAAPAVDSLSLEVAAGEIFGFLGPNGAGKTTTIKAIVGLLRPDSGRIVVDGIDAWADPIAAKRRIGFVPDTPDVYDRLTGREYLAFVADVFEVPQAEREQRANELLEMFALKDAIGDLTQSYSHGMRQKLAVTAALIHRPRLFILDEPMTGLDPRSSHLFKEMMRNHCGQGGSVFFSTHILDVAERLCDRIGIINRGRLVAVGTMDELRQQATGESTLERIFLELTKE
jgi:ABC-2 type transport system ATP-binding protein